LHASGFRRRRAVPAAGPSGDGRRAVGPAWATLANLGQDALRVFGQQNKKHDDWTAKKKHASNLSCVSHPDFSQIVGVSVLF
jgi:hypothetical protein